MSGSSYFSEAVLQACFRFTRKSERSSQGFKDPRANGTIQRLLALGIHRQGKQEQQIMDP